MDWLTNQIRSLVVDCNGSFKEKRANQNRRDMESGFEKMHVRCSKRESYPPSQLPALGDEWNSRLINGSGFFQKFQITTNLQLGFGLQGKRYGCGKPMCDSQSIHDKMLRVFVIISLSPLTSSLSFSSYGLQPLQCGRFAFESANCNISLRVYPLSV